VWWYGSDGRRELCKVNDVVVQLSGDCSAKALQGQRCGGRPLLGGLILMFSTLSKKTFIELPFDNCRGLQLTLRSTIYHSLIAESSLIPNISLVADYCWWVWVRDFLGTSIRPIKSISVTQT
jgi:hypothetical protein